MATEVKVPTLGESITEATLGQWLKKPGEAVKRGRADRQPRDRQGRGRGHAPSPACWASSCVKEGDTVEVGAVIARIEAGGAAAAAAGARRAGDANAGQPGRPGRDAGAAVRSDRAARRAMAIRHACRPRCAARCSSIISIRRKIKGTGKDGRLTKDDVLAAAEDAARPAPAAARRRAGAPRLRAARRRPGRRRPPPGERREERVRMTRLRQTIAQPAQGSAEHRRAADDVQRRRHDRGDRGAQPLQGSVREEARHPPRLHGLLREGGGAGGARRARGQRLDRRRRDRLSRLSRRLGRGLARRTASSSRSSATRRR